jgi:hypothetical protein
MPPTALAPPGLLPQVESMLKQTGQCSPSLLLQLYVVFLEHTAQMKELLSLLPEWMSPSAFTTYRSNWVL